MTNTETQVLAPNTETEIEVLPQEVIDEVVEVLDDIDDDVIETDEETRRIAESIFDDVIEEFNIERENELNDIQDIKLAQHFYRQSELLQKQATQTKELAEKLHNKAQFFMFGDSKLASLPRYAENQLSAKDLIFHGVPNHSLDVFITKAFYKYMYQMFNDNRFTKRGKSLYAADGITPFILCRDSSNSSNFVIGECAMREFREPQLMYLVTDDFIFWLAKQDSWSGIAQGKFEKEIANLLREDA